MIILKGRELIVSASQRAFMVAVFITIQSLKCLMRHCSQQIGQIPVSPIQDSRVQVKGSHRCQDQGLAMINSHELAKFYFH